MIAAAFPLAVSFRPEPSRPAKGAGWHEAAWLVVFATVAIACTVPGPRSALLAALAIAAGAWAVLAHAEPHDRWTQLGESGWLWATGCYQWLRASRQDFWHGGVGRGGWR